MEHLIKFQRKEDKLPSLYTPQEFEQATGVHYLDRHRFATLQVERKIRRQCLKALRWGCIENERKWLGAYHKKEIEEGIVADVTIRWADDKMGYGLFSNKEFPLGTFIGAYTGLIRKKNPLRSKTNDYCFSYPTSVLFWQKHSIDALSQGNEMRYVNHSNEPNCESVGVFYRGLLYVIIRAIQKIPKNTQLFYDYGNDDFKW